MREIGRFVARLELIADEMDRLLCEEPSLGGRRGYATFSAWRGPEAEDAVRHAENIRRRFDALATEGRHLSGEACRFLRSEGIDTSSPELDELERQWNGVPTPTQLAAYCRAIAASYRAKAMLL